MNPSELLLRIRQRPLLLDGGLGTMLISMGLAPGQAPEAWNLEYPERVAEAHRRYASAGSDVVHANTFGANPVKLAASGLEGRCWQLNAVAVELARSASPSVLVAGDIGPTGRFLPPMGDADEGSLEEAFRTQAAALAAAGVDLISIETMYDLREALAAVRAAAATGLAVLCSMTFDQKKRGIFTIMGDRPGPSLTALHEAGATVVGFNCTVTSETMAAMVGKLSAELQGLPLVMQPNAGQPRTIADGIVYDAVPAAFASDIATMVASGVRVVGGCCGTDDGFIRTIRSALDAMDEPGDG